MLHRQPSMNTQTVPEVSIGLFVYNAAEHIGSALDSLLAQTYPNFRLVVSDNGSRDATQEIVRAYAARDARIHYVRSEENRGVLWNFHNVFDASSGEYFMWAGHHDLWHPEFVASCVRELQASPEAVLAYTRTQYIDPRGANMPESEPAVDTRGLSPGARLARVLSEYPICAIYGLIRRSVLAKLRNEHGIGQRHPLNHTMPDVTLLAELACEGAFALVPETYYFNRVFKGRNWTIEDKVAQLNPPTGGNARRAYWSLLRTLFAIGRDTPMSAEERVRFYQAVLKRWALPYRKRLLYEADVLGVGRRVKRLVAGIGAPRA